MGPIGGSVGVEEEMIKVTSSVENFLPSMVAKRYVCAYRCEINEMRWREIGCNQRFDLRHGICGQEDLPSDILQAALNRRISGPWPFYVEWPL